jgi:hypothetical protein
MKRRDNVPFFDLNSTWITIIHPRKFNWSKYISGNQLKIPSKIENGSNGQIETDELFHQKLKQTHSHYIIIY